MPQYQGIIYDLWHYSLNVYVPEWQTWLMSMAVGVIVTSVWIFKYLGGSVPQKWRECRDLIYSVFSTERNICRLTNVICFTTKMTPLYYQYDRPIRRFSLSHQAILMVSTNPICCYTGAPTLVVWWYTTRMTTIPSIMAPMAYGELRHDDVIKWKQFTRYWHFVRGIQRPPVNSPHKGQWRGAVVFLWSVP